MCAPGGLGAAGQEITHQFIDMRLREPLDRDIAETLPQRLRVIFQLRPRRRPQPVSTGQIVRAHLLDGDRPTGHEPAPRGLVADLRQRPAGLSLSGVAPPDLLTSTGIRAYTGVDRKLLAHNLFGGSAISDLDLADLWR